MARKIPPPPQLTGPEWQAFNRWLLELTSVLSNSGGINPEEVTGLPAVISQVAVNTDDIHSLGIAITAQAGDINGLQNSINAINLQLAAINGQITTLNARGEVLFGAGAPAAGLGKVKDWYGDPAGAVGSRIWIKTAVGVWTPFPF